MSQTHVSQTHTHYLCYFPSSPAFATHLCLRQAGAGRPAASPRSRAEGSAGGPGALRKPGRLCSDCWVEAEVSPGTGERQVEYQACSPCWARKAATGLLAAGSLVFCGSVWPPDVARAQLWRMWRVLVELMEWRAQHSHFMDATTEAEEGRASPAPHGTRLSPSVPHRPCPMAGPGPA